MFGEHQLLNIVIVLVLHLLKKIHINLILILDVFQTFKLPNLVLVLGSKDGRYEANKYYVSLVLRPA